MIETQNFEATKITQTRCYRLVFVWVGLWPCVRRFAGGLRASGHKFDGKKLAYNVLRLCDGRQQKL